MAIALCAEECKLCSPGPVTDRVCDRCERFTCSDHGVAVCVEKAGAPPLVGPVKWLCDDCIETW